MSDDPKRSLTLKESTNAADLFSVMVDNKTTLQEVRSMAGTFLTTKDRFLNKQKAPVAASDESFPVATYADPVGEILLFQRFVEPAEPVVVPPGAFTVTRGEGEDDKRTVALTEAQRLIELRQKLADFMKETDYFLGLGGGKITDERKFCVGEIAKERVIRIGPTKNPIKPSVVTLPETDVPALPSVTWGIPPAPGTPTLPDEPRTPSTTPGVLAPQEYYIGQPVAQKQALFQKLILDRGLIVRKPGDGDQFAQSSASPAWYVPSGEGPEASTPADSDTHRYWAAATRVTSEMRKRGINQATLNGSWSDATGLNGLALRSSYSRDSEEYSRKITTATYVIEERTVRKITLTMYNRDLRPKQSFVAAVARIMNSSESRITKYSKMHSDIFARFGYFFPTEIVLGGKWLKEYKLEASDTTATSNLVQQITAGGDGKATTEDGTFGLGLAYKNYSAAFESDQVVKQLKSQAASKTGGSAAASIDKDDGAWVNSLAEIRNWAVIETNKLLPVVSLLEGDADTDRLRRQCISLINEFAANTISEENTAIDMESYISYLHTREAEKLGLF